MFHMKSSNANGINPMEYGINNLVNGKVSSPGMAKGINPFNTSSVNYLVCTYGLNRQKIILIPIYHLQKIIIMAQQTQRRQIISMTF